MKCKNCNSEINNDAKFCSRCGCSNNNTVINSLEKKENDLDKLLITSYLQGDDKMYNNINDKKININIYATLFGLFYYIYRKMYLISFCLLILILFISYFYDTKLMILNILLGILFNPLYKWDIDRKIKKIKSKNPSVNLEQLILLTTKKGGTSKIGVIISILVITIIVIGFILVALFYIKFFIDFSKTFFEGLRNFYVN